MEMNYSDYIIYVDESGDPNLENPNPSYPMFVLAFCIFKKIDYSKQVSPSIQDFKFKHFGHDSVVLHEHEIRKQRAPFIFLKNVKKRDVFMLDLDKLIDDAPMTVVAAAIDKLKLKKKYVNPRDPYHLALQFCMERVDKLMRNRGQENRVTHIVVERRGKNEDRDLELEFRRIRDGGNYSGERLDTLEIVFADKKANSGGLQLADLIARPIGISGLRPTQSNRAYDIIKSKFDVGKNNNPDGFGLKSFP